MKSKNSHQGKKHIGNVLTQVLNTLLIATLTFSGVFSVGILSSCGGDSPSDYVEPVTPPTPTKNTPPTIETKLTEIDVTGGKEIRITGNQLYIGSQLVASWSDKETTTCEVKLTVDGEEVKAGTSLTDEGSLTLTVTDGSGESKSITVKLKITNGAPEIKLELSELNVFAGAEVSIADNKLMIGGEVVASWTDDRTEQCEVKLTLDGKEVKTGDMLAEAGTLTLTVTDAEEKSVTAEITLMDDSIYGMEALNSLNLQVDAEADLLNGISFAEGIELVKVEVEVDGQRYEVNDPTHYTPVNPGTCKVIFTVKGKFENSGEISSGMLTIKGIEYQSMNITNIKPVDVFPQISKIEAGDPDIYEYIKDLGVAEAYVMRDMMTKYGTGKYSPEEYQQLLSRMNIGLIGELSDDYQNYGRIGPVVESPYIGDHARCTSQNLLSLKGDFTKVKNLSSLPHGSWARNLLEYVKAHPNDIFIFSHSLSAIAYSQSEYKQEVFDQNIVDLCDLPNVIIFVVGGDTTTENGIPMKKVYNSEYKSNGDGKYREASMANSDKNNRPNSNMRVIIGRNANGNADMTNSQGSVVPIGFNKKSLVSGHPILPFYNYYPGAYYGKLYGEELPRNGSYPVSHPAPAIASETQMMFGLRADVKDANELLKMIESSTADPDYISLNGETWEIQKYSPANFIKKYCMTVDVPSSIASGETIALQKGYYKGIVFNIPGAEVLINGEWIPFTAQNEQLIKQQNPMNLEWRLNSALYKKMGISSNVQGEIIAVDDQWNGLSITKDFSVQVK